MRASVQEHLDDLEERGFSRENLIEITDVIPVGQEFDMVIIPEIRDRAEAKSYFSQLDKTDKIKMLAIGTEFIPLSEIQALTKTPSIVVGANWTEPAHTTYFLELVQNDTTDPDLVKKLSTIAEEEWGKDPYTIKGELGIRSKMVCALLREAFDMVKNEYATVEDIDRACKNDPGTYMPLVGNFRYMDIMGTYAYGMVMRELNKELSVDNTMPDFVKELEDNKHLGIKSGKGFYDYPGAKAKEIRSDMRDFSYRIRSLMDKYNS